MSTKEIREKSIGELYKDLRDLKKEYTLLFLSSKIGKTVDLSKKKSIKKEISRINTIISEKEILKQH